MVEWRSKIVPIDEYERLHQYSEQMREFAEKRLTQEDDSVDFLWWGIAILGCCAFWAVMAVFCWGGNLVPRW